jgi:hypothetical protein
VPLEVTADGFSDLFWKYYLLSDDDAKSLITDYINARIQAEESVRQESKPKEVQATISDAGVKEPLQESRLPQRAVGSLSMNALDESGLAEFAYEPEVSFSTVIDTEEKVKLVKKPLSPPVQETLMAPFPQDDKFFAKVKSFFDSSGIQITEFSIMKKSLEYDFVISLPSNVGSLTYYCKAKSKSKISDSDLSTAFVKGQIKRLPVLFITQGELTKSAKELASKEFKSMFVRKI